MEDHRIRSFHVSSRYLYLLDFLTLKEKEELTQNIYVYEGMSTQSIPEKDLIDTFLVLTGKRCNDYLLYKTASSRMNSCDRRYYINIMSSEMRRRIKERLR